MQNWTYMQIGLNDIEILYIDLQTWTSNLLHTYLSIFPFRSVPDNDIETQRGHHGLARQQKTMLFVLCLLVSVYVLWLNFCHWQSYKQEQIKLKFGFFCSQKVEFYVFPFCSVPDNYIESQRGHLWIGKVAKDNAFGTMSLGGSLHVMTSFCSLTII